MTSLQIKVGIIGNDSEKFNELFNDILEDNVKIHKNFSVTTNIIKTVTNKLFQQYNYIFFITDLSNNLNTIKQFSSKISSPRNHLFIIIDGCTKMKVDDEGELIFTDPEQKQTMKKIHETLNVILEEDTYTVIPLSMTFSKIYNKIMVDESIAGLTSEEIDILIGNCAPKLMKASIADKKREIKTFLKKENIEDKLANFGFNELINGITTYFKLVYQKKVICDNYIQMFNEYSLDNTSESVDELVSMIKEIDDIDFLKPQMMDDLLNKVSVALEKNLTQLFDKYHEKLGFGKGSIDIYQYKSLLSKLHGIVINNKISVSKIIDKEKESVNQLIVNHHNKEMEKIIDLDKIYSLLEIFSDSGDDSFMILFNKIGENTKIMEENMNHMDRWINFIDRCAKIGIPKQSILGLIEKVIISKITYYCDASKIQRSGLSIIYPYCLHTFLLANLNKHFIFRKLSMITSYHMRYSGRNIMETIYNLTNDEFDSLLTLECHLVKLIDMKFEEYSQKVDIENIRIVETFNASAKIT